MLWVELFSPAAGDTLPVPDLCAWRRPSVTATSATPGRHVPPQVDHTHARVKERNHLARAYAHLFAQQGQFDDGSLQDRLIGIGQRFEPFRDDIGRRMNFSHGYSPRASLRAG